MSAAVLQVNFCKLHCAECWQEYSLEQRLLAIRQQTIDSLHYMTAARVDMLAQRLKLEQLPHLYPQFRPCLQSSLYHGALPCKSSNMPE